MIFRVCLPSTLPVDAGHRVFEPVRKMLGLDEELEGAFRPKGYLPHDLPSKDQRFELSARRRLCLSLQRH
jgi:hypothetical protein